MTEGPTDVQPDEARSNLLIAELVADLRPVRPIPSLRTAVGGILGVWLAAAAVSLFLNDFSPERIGGFAGWIGPGGVFTGLGMMGLGGVVAALALAAPGRERAARGGALFAMLGLGLSAGIGTYLVINGQNGVLQNGSGIADLTCLLIACAVAAVPAVGVTMLAGRAAPFRPLVLVIAAAAGTAAWGAVTAQATCPYGGLRHLMVGHLMAPAIGALLLSLPLLFVLRRSDRA